VSLPVSFLCSLIGIFIDRAKTPAKIGVVLSLVNVTVFVGLPVVASVVC
jgi:hypothetical protein